MTRRKARRIVHGVQTDARNEVLVARERLERLTPWQKLSQLHPLWSIVLFGTLVVVSVLAQQTISGWAPENRIVYRTQDISTKPGEQPHDSKAARVEAHRLCGGYAQTFDVQNQAVLVYACTDGKLQVLTYQPGNG
jgi:hypothetical protein